MRRLDVDCSGGRSGSGPATWGQEAIWSVVRNLGSDAARYNVSAGSPVPPGVPVALTVESLRKLVLMHDSLRTRLLLDEDAGTLRQVVDAAGVVTVTCRTCPEDQAEVVEHEGRALLDELNNRPFDNEREWPIRVGIVEYAGQVRHMAFSLAHTAVDAWGLQRMILNLTMLAMGGSPEWISERRPALQPLEEAEFQRSARGQRQDASARRHWREKARLGPARLFPAEPGAADGPRFPNAVLNSPALNRALQLVAAGRQVSSSAVLLAAASTMLCRLSGSSDAVLQIVVNNRFQPHLTHSVSSVAQEGLFYLPGVQSVGFADAARRAQSASLGVYRNAYYDKALLDQNIAEWSAQDGTAVDLSCILNDYRGLMPTPDQVNELGEPSEPNRDVRQAEPEVPNVPRVPLAKECSRTTLAWPVEHEPRRNVTFALDALDAPGSIELAMTADSAVLPRADMERMLFGIEDLVVADALALGE